MIEFIHNKYKKPPLGIMPKQIHRQLRIEDLKGAVNRYMFKCKKVPIEWIDEYNELVEEMGE